jgi:hypothetical protein
MRNKIITACVMLFANYAQGQSFQYYQSKDGTNNATTVAVTCDNQEKTITGGTFGGTLTANGNNYTVGSSQSIYIQKLDYNGNNIWVKTFNTNSGAAYLTDIKTDDNNNIYFSAYFSGSVTIGTNTYVSVGYDILLVKIDANGNVLWSKTAGTSGSDKGLALTINGSNVYLVGEYNGNITFGSLPVLNAIGGVDAFITCYDGSSGNALWRKGWGNSTSSENCVSVETDASGNVYLLGRFQGTLSFDSYSLSSFDGYGDIYIAKMNSTGAFQWVKREGGIGGGETARNLTVDPFGNVYTLFHSPTYTSALDVSTNSVTGTYNQDFILTKLSSNGTPLWIKLVAEHNCISNSGKITLDESGQTIYICGTFGPSGILPTMPMFYTYPQGSEFLFVSKWDDAGVPKSFKLIGAEYSLTGLGIAKNSVDNMFLVGQYSGWVTTSTTSPFTPSITSTGNDGFLIRMNPQVFPMLIGSNNSSSLTFEDFLYDVEANSKNQIIATGGYEGIVDFGNGNITSSSYGSTDIYVAKYDVSGDLKWLASSGSTSATTSNETGHNLAVDVNDNIYVNGYFVSPSTIKSVGGSPSVILNYASSMNGFLAKYNDNGVLQWAINTHDDVKKICVDNFSNVYVAGTYSSACTFPSSSVSLPAAVGGIDGFIAKYNSSGIIQWAVPISGTGSTELNSISCDNSFLYIVGNYDTDVNFGNSITLTSSSSFGLTDFYVAQLNLNGIAQSVLSGGTSSYDHGTGVYANNTNGVYVTGYTNNGSGNIMFTGNPTSLVAPIANGSRFVAKADFVLNTWSWAKTDGGVPSRSIKVKGTNLYTCGYVWLNNTKFNNGTLLISPHSAPQITGAADHFIEKMDVNGNFSWVKTIGTTGPASYTYPQIAVNDQFDLIMAGTLKNNYDNNTGTYSLDFNPVVKNCYGSYDIYIEKFSDYDGVSARLLEPNETLSEEGNINKGSKMVKIFPNPNLGEFILDIQSSFTNNTNLYLVDVSGRILHTQAISIQEGTTQIQLDKTDLPSGIYFIKIDGFDQTLKMIISK